MSESTTALPSNIVVKNLEEDQLEAWFDHLAEVFPTPRDYFVNHWNNDPTKDTKAWDTSTNVIASTVKVYQREFLYEGKHIRLGGLGEVSTKLMYRKKGLATHLIKNSLDFMKSRNIQIGGLHTRLSAAFYASLGWKAVNRYLLKKPLHSFKSEEIQLGKAEKIRRADFTSEKEIEALSNVYETYSSQFNGPIVRKDKRYWTEWICNEVPNSFVLLSMDEQDKEMEIQACISLKRAREFVLADFFAAPIICKEDGGRAAFERLLRFALNQISFGGDVNSLLYAAPLFSPIDPQAEVVVDGGGMYYVVDPTVGIETSTLAQQLSRTQDITAANSKYAFWNADSY